MRAALIIAIAALGACSTITRGNMAQLIPLDDKTFLYLAEANAIYPLDSPAAEATRMAWLDAYLADAGLCADGFEITERSPPTNGPQIRYRGHCRQ